MWVVVRQDDWVGGDEVAGVVGPGVATGTGVELAGMRTRPLKDPDAAEDRLLFCRTASTGTRGRKCHPVLRPARADGR
jgi:hypothetical protein